MLYDGGDKQSIPTRGYGGDKRSVVSPQGGMGETSAAQYPPQGVWGQHASTVLKKLIYSSPPR